MLRLPLPSRFGAFLLVTVACSQSPAPLNAAPIFHASHALSFSGGPGQLAGDLVATGDGAAAVYALPVGTETHLAFYRMGPNAQILAERMHSLAPWPCYEPAIAWTGQEFGVAVSTHTQSFFLRLAPNGDLLAPAYQLPGLPSGADAGRTAAFKVIWTGQHYAIFGLWLQRQYPWQELTQGLFYTRLQYWLLDTQGELLAHSTLQTLAPTSYPSGEGAEKNYFDVAWTGQSFFVAYYCESQSGPPLSVYYRVYAPDGTLLRAEQPLLAAQVAQGPKLAWNGQTVAATALKTISMPHPDAGNYMYLRCFGADGNPRGVESAYGHKLGYGPTVSWIGNRFLTAYCMMYDMNTLGYTLMLNSFDEQGLPIGTEQPLRNAQGGSVLGRMALGVDLQIAGAGNVLYCKSQTSDAWNIRISPLWFTLHNDYLVPPALKLVPQGNQALIRWPAEGAPFRLQATADLKTPDWSDVAPVPAFEQDGYTVALPATGTQFFRLAH